MTTKLELDDELVRRAKVEATLRGTSLDAFVEQVLRDRISAATTAPTQRITLPTHDLGGAQPEVDLDDSRGLRELMDKDGIARC